MTQEDEEGMTGIKIGKELMCVAGRALRMNITRLAPLVLPVSEKLVYALHMTARKVSCWSCTPPPAHTICPSGISESRRKRVVALAMQGLGNQAFCMRLSMHHRLVSVSDKSPLC